jgi:predicted nucleic acid-binding protein
MIVIDNSVAASWYLPEEAASSLAVLKYLEENRSVRMLVPSLWYLEITNTLLVMERRKKILREDRLKAIEHIQLLPLDSAEPPTARMLFILEELAHRHQLSAYDAEYLRVAKDAKAPLATVDKALIRAAGKEGVVLFQP